jgi:hypothetical protein
MIRSRKDEGTSASTTITSSVSTSPSMIVGGLNKHDNTVSTSTLGNNHNNTNVATTIPSPANFRFQRTSSNVGTSKTTMISATSTSSTTTPTAKRAHSSIASIGMNKEDNNNISAPSATAVSSFANTASSSVSSSLQYYNNLLQHQMYNIRKGRTKKKLKHHNNEFSSIWTVQMPKRMLFGTMGIFLLIPVVLFVYKEMHLPHLDEKELRGKRHNDLSSDGKFVVKMSNRNQEYVTWMANFLANEEVDDEDEETEAQLDSAALAAIMDSNETISNENFDNNAIGATSDMHDDLFVKSKMRGEEDVMKKEPIKDDVYESEQALDAFVKAVDNV